MMSSAAAFELLSELLGFRAEPTRAGEVARALEERLRVRRCADASAYRLLLDDPRIRAHEAQALADRLTVNETYFLREQEHLRVIVDKLVPALLASGASPVRILSVGCSTGEEPYGVALLLLEAGVARGQVEISGIDASARVVALARRARYSEWALRNVPPELRRRYFTQHPEGHVLAREIYEWVQFEVANVLEASAPARGGPFDIVLCRNVLIYLTPEATERVIERLSSLLTPGGHLFLGHAETALAGARFSVEEARGAFYFRRRGRSEAPKGSRPVASFSEAIGRSAARVEQLSSPGALPTPASPSRGEHDEIEAALELLRQERFAEALSLVEKRVGEPESERGLLRALLLTNLGRTREAARAAEARLAVLPSCPFGHYLLGLCREQLLEFEEARRHYLLSAELDATFAMPRLRAGLLARRAGLVEEARHALEQALERFPGQSRKTQLLYAGGFAPELLASLCQAELSRLGGVR